MEISPWKKVGTGQSGPIILGLMYRDRASVLQVRAGLEKVDLITSAMPSGSKPSATLGGDQERWQPSFLSQVETVASNWDREESELRSSWLDLPGIEYLG